MPTGVADVFVAVLMCSCSMSDSAEVSVLVVDGTQLVAEVGALLFLAGWGGCGCGVGCGGGGCNNKKQHNRLRVHCDQSGKEHAHCRSFSMLHHLPLAAAAYS